MPADHPEPVIFEHVAEPGDRLKLTAACLDDPPPQELLRGVGILDLIEAVELLGERVGPHGLKRLGEQLVEQVALALGEVRRPLEPHVPRVGQQVAMVL
jgi:hypothetical protein